jgi:DNA-binding NarL/FixJ family response regulator
VATVVRVVLVDDHELFLGAVREVLERPDERASAVRFEVVGTAGDGRVTLPLVERVRPQMVVMDVELPGLDGLSCLDLLHERRPEVTVVMLSAHFERDYVRSSFARGAAAYILKTVEPADLRSALRLTFERTAFLMAPGIVATADEYGLTRRQIEILRCVARGLSNAQIARELFVTEQTVKFHLGNIYRRLGVDNRTAAASEARRLGLLSSTTLSEDLIARVRGNGRLWPP